MTGERNADGERRAQTAERAAAITRGVEADEAATAKKSGARPNRRKEPSGARRGTEIDFRPLANSVRDYAIFLLDPDGIITFWGTGARLMKGWRKEEAEGAHLRLLYPEAGAEDGTAEEHLRLAAETGEYAGEGQRVRRDGSRFWASVTLTALRDDEGVLLGFSNVTRDLTAQRAVQAAIRANEAQERARAVAEEAYTAKSQFFASMTHEFRTPLSAILGYTTLLQEELAGGTLNDKQRQYLARLRLSGEHLATLVNQILDLSRLEAHGITVERVRVRLGEVVTGALALVEPQARERGLVLANDVSTTAAALYCYGDELRVRQILVNVLANAIKFTDAHEGTRGRVTISAGAAELPARDAQLEGAGPWAFIRIEDTGRGIPAERQSAIFDPYVQADGSSRDGKGGAGLGLAIGRELARLMQGDLTVYSAPDEGSTFTLWLAAAPSAPAAGARVDSRNAVAPSQ
jgi:PAS domain S-box-containing protein